MTNTKQDLPNDVGAERALLSAMLLDNEAALKAANTLIDAEAFYNAKHAEIYTAMLTLVHKRISPTLVTLRSELQRTGKLELIGGLPYLMELGNELGFSGQVPTYIESILDMAMLRKTIKLAQETAQLGYDTTKTREDVIEFLNQELTKMTAASAMRGPVPMAELVDAYFEELQHLAESGESIQTIPTGFEDMDKQLGGGMQRSDLLILAARPATGKTSLALNIANYAAEAQYKVLVFSLEMSKNQLLQRMLATNTGIDMKLVRAGNVPDRDLALLTTALGGFSKLPMWIDDSAGASLAYVRSKALKIQAEHGLDFIVIDYLQLMQGSGKKGANRQEEVAEISRGLKGLAKELDVPVLALSQLSRAVESRTSHVPMLSDLRESGAIEQDSDIVMFIHREELYDPETDKKGIAEIHVAKHRNGPTFITPLRFFRSTTKFSNLETYRQPEGY